MVMKRFFKTSIIVLVVFIISPKVSAQVYSKDLKEIAKGINAHNRAVHIFDDWMRDPFITIAPDGSYYLTMTQHGDTIDGRAVVSAGAAYYKSEDLVKWDFAGYFYDILRDAENATEYIDKWEEKRANGLKDPLKLWAPEFHFINGKWNILHTSNVGIGNLVSTRGDKLSGPYKGWNEKFGRQHDPTIFQDDDGSCWLVSRCTQIQKLNKDLTAFDGPPMNISPSNRKMGHEGAYIIKFEGKYVLFGTAWSGDVLRHGTYNLYYAVADKLEGLYGERQFAGRFLGHGTPFKDKQGRWWCTAFYNANTPTMTREESRTLDVSETAYTLNKQGLTLVPLEIKMVDGKVKVWTKDPDYREPGKEEIQQF